MRIEGLAPYKVLFRLNASSGDQGRAEVKRLQSRRCNQITEQILAPSSLTYQAVSSAASSANCLLLPEPLTLNPYHTLPSTPKPLLGLGD